MPARFPDTDRPTVVRVAQQPYLRVDRNDYSVDPLFARSKATATAHAAKSSTPAAPRDSPKSAGRSPSAPSPRPQNASQHADSHPGARPTDLERPSPTVAPLSSPGRGQVSTGASWPSFQPALTTAPRDCAVSRSDLNGLTPEPAAFAAVRSGPPEQPYVQPQARLRVPATRRTPAKPGPGLRSTHG